MLAPLYPYRSCAQEVESHDDSVRRSEEVKEQRDVAAQSSYSDLTLNISVFACGSTSPSVKKV